GGGRSDALFAAVYIGLGLCLSLALYDTLSRLRVARPVAAAAAILVLANPSVILFQSILFYPYLELVLLTLAAWSLARFLTAALFGTPTLQSWFGMNLYNVAPKGEQARRVPQHGLIFPDAHAFAPFPEYVPAFDETPARGVPVLDSYFKAPGVPNFNYAGYLP